jgi:glycosyltransferase involved in cell wall biosynthesis
MHSINAHLFWASACLGTGIPFVYSERNAPAFVLRNWSRDGRNAALSAADGIHLLLPGAAKSVPKYLHHKVYVIPHARPIVSLPANPAGDYHRRKILLYLARMVAQKRPQLLLHAFHILCERHWDWDLVMWGTGSEETRLRLSVSAWNLKDRVRFCGLCLNTPAAYADAQLYCLPSAFEGFGLTLLEAMGAGLPVVGVADCEAMRSIVTPGVDGLLASEATPQSLAATLHTLMSDADLRRSLGAGALQTASRYVPQKIYDQWEALLTCVVARKSRTVMDGFADEPFATKAELSRLARQEWLFRPEKEPLPGSVSWAGCRMRQLVNNITCSLLSG